MIEAVADWITGITCAAMINAIAGAVMPEGGAKKVGKMVGGLLLLAAVVRPLPFLDMEKFSLWPTRGGQGFPAAEAESAQEGNQLLKSLIEERTEAYILGRAKELGIDCAARVSCRYDGESGLFYPNEIILSGELGKEDREQLLSIIKHEIGSSVKYFNDTEEVGKNGEG